MVTSGVVKNKTTSEEFIRHLKNLYSLKISCKNDIVNKIGEKKIFDLNNY